jgi:lipopolysaccharide export system permease protein
MKGSFFNMISKDPMLIFSNQKVMTRIPDHLVYAKKEDGKLKHFQMVKMKDNVPEAIAIAREAEVSVDLEGDDPELLLEMFEVNLMLRGEEGGFMESAQPVFMGAAPAGVSIEKFKENVDGIHDQPENISLRRLFGKVSDETLEPEDRATYRTELSMRMAFSVSCITFALIGVPLGITAQRRESTAGFVLSMVIAVTYYVMLTIAQMMRENEGLYPHILVWVPNILFLTLGFVMFKRLSQK